MVYYVMQGREYERTEPMDNAAFQEWQASYMTGATIRYELPTMDLTEENIGEIKKLVEQLRQ